jgi:ribosome-interacting GTPase 1
MPANLTPQYHKAEDEYRRAQSANERLACLENMLRLIPKHKGTDKLQADLKHRIKVERDEIQAEKSAPKKGSGASFRIPRQGAGTVLVIGAPNAGKSRIVKELTSANPVVANYPFATREPLPGMMTWNDVTVQLVDTPPIAADRMEGYLAGMVRSADALVLAFDGSSDDAPDETLAAAAELAERSTFLSAENGFGEEDYSQVRVKTLLVATRGDDPGLADRLAYWREIRTAGASGLAEIPELKVELDRPECAQELRNAIYELLAVIRVYTKAPGKKADMEKPYTLPAGGTAADLAAKVHRELADKLRHAKIWSRGSTDAQTVGPDHALSDGDVAELHTA